MAGDGRDELDALPLRERAIGRSVADRYAQAADEVQRLLDATYRVIERQGTLEPRVRDILAEAGLATQAFYRHFASKDELLLVVLEDGRRQIAEYLDHRMAKVRSQGPVAEVRAWIGGVMAQATDAGAAARTRPFMAGLARLTELFPAEQEASVALLVDLLAGAVRRGVEADVFAVADAEGSARLVYQLAFAVLGDHLAARTAPTRREVAALEAFCLSGLGAP